jgi:hypothetical protein
MVEETTKNPHHENRCHVPNSNLEWPERQNNITSTKYCMILITFLMATELNFHWWKIAWSSAVWNSDVLSEDVIQLLYITCNGVIFTTFCNSMKQSPSGEAGSKSTSQYIPRFSCNAKFHYRVHNSQLMGLFWTTRIHSTSSHPISSRSVSILSSHLLLGIRSGILFP